MRYVYPFILATALFGCEVAGSDLFGDDAGTGRGGAGGKPGGPSASSGSAQASSSAGGAAMSSSSSGSGGAAQSSSVAATSAASSSSSGGQSLYWASGVQQNVPIASLNGWKECWSSIYADTGTPQSQILSACAGGKLMLACRPKGSATLTLAAMGNTGDVSFVFPPNDNTSTHEANGVGWYMSNNNWGFAPAGDTVWKGPFDVTGISPSVPGPDGDKRMSWTGNLGQMWVGYRCGYDCYENHPGFDYNYERVVFSAP